MHAQYLNVSEWNKMPKVQFKENTSGILNIFASSKTNSSNINKQFINNLENTNDFAKINKVIRNLTILQLHVSNARKELLNDRINKYNKMYIDKQYFKIHLIINEYFKTIKNYANEKNVAKILINTQRLTAMFISIKDKHKSNKFRKNKPKWWGKYFLTLYSLLISLSLCSIGKLMCDFHMWLIYTIHFIF